MANKDKKKKNLTGKQTHKYTFAVSHTDTHKERFSFQLTRLRTIIWAVVLVFLIFILAFFTISYTPLREYVPGYASSKVKKQAIMLTYKADSLEQVINRNERYYNSIQNILLGDTLTDMDEAATDLKKDKVVLTENRGSEATMKDINLHPSKMDSILRKEVENNERYNIFNPFLDSSDVDLYPPVNGMVSQHFDVEERHYGVDISLEENSPVKATAEGIVVFAEWTVETGFVIIIKHDFDLLSVYKHNLALLKKQGEFVKKGEVIALTGNTGAYTTGPHLHFELWEGGHALDPEDFFDFD